MQKNTEISERINQLIDYVGDSKNEFAKKLGYERSQSIYDISNGKSKPSFDFFEKLLNSEYSEIINIEYLISGIGNIEKTKSAEKVNKKNVDLNVDQNVTKPNVQKKSTNEDEKPNVQKKYPNDLGTSLGTQLGINEMFKKSTQTKEEKPNEEVSEIEKGVKLYKGKAIEESEGIPLIPIEAMAGFGSGEVQVMDYETSNYKVPEFTELKANFMIRVKGSSMYPKYSSGDLVACKKLYLSDIFFQWNKVYVLDTAQGAIIKRVKKGSDKEHLLLISENPNYDPFELHISQINAIALVVGVIRLE